ncbi:hypothetical protein DEO72_LG11g3037 [Vigna unguiculata]|uniref:Uncharacterized protein n=1 Tax=Vigna unguiculata TaxID=3917 RepID=A0A4D6NTM7_VIGUN|nr:hypothetical protein DEO72_LG11g3037 [Vigna unguiculata]
MKALGWWLIAVGTLRLASVWFGFFDIWALRLAVFSKTTTSATVLVSLDLMSFLRNIDNMDAIAVEFSLESPLETLLTSKKRWGQKCNITIGGVGRFKIEEETQL